MPRKYTVTEYDKEDIEKLDDMPKEEVIALLEHIERGWLPQDYVYAPEEYETYTESEYETTRLHKAIRKAIQMLEEK